MRLSSCPRAFRFSPGISVAVSIYLITSATVLKILVQLLRPESGTRFAHLFMATSVFKTDFLIPLSADEKGWYFHFRILANHFASFFFSVGWFLRTTICPVYPSLYPSGHRVQTSVGFHSDLDLLLQPRGIDLHSYSSFLMVNLWRPVNSNMEG